jgi:GT2 family glycosyltransferase
MEHESGFTASVYFRVDSGYSEQRKGSASAPAVAGIHRLRFDVPPDATGLRLDLAERPGFMRLRAIRLSRDGSIAWKWSDTTEDRRVLVTCARHQLVLSGVPGSPVLLCGDDPWVELPVPSSVLAQAANLQLEIELGWIADSEVARSPGTAQLALESLAVQTGHARALADQLARARELHLRSRMEVRRVAKEGAAVRRELALLRRDVPLTEPIAPTVDVIIPVYRDLAETRRCIKAVLSSPVQTAWRLLVVNDASPEPELASWLRGLAAGDARVVLMENRENLGYSGTVNRGITCSETHDVVLLNSDAEVANDWLDRLRATAYRSGEPVCSVTPFSNNATICSYPNICEDNPLPAGWTVGELDRAFASANRGQVLEVPTAVGFCMYVRRDCLREVGLFDMDLFGKGYGEENDFCLRAADAGWRNLHALDVFVRHTGGASFGASKPQRELEAMVTLRQLYPEYERQVHAYIALDPPAAARARATVACASLGGKSPAGTAP